MAKRTDIPPLRKIVEARVDTLLNKALEVAKERPQDARRYVQLAQKLSMRHRVRMGAERKRKFCKKCQLPLIENYTLKITKEGDWEIYTCVCGAKRKFHL